jgi:hypothetical protein
MLEDKEPLVDRVRAEYDRRRQERNPPLVTRPHDWPKEATMEEQTITVGTDDGQVTDEDLADHLGSWHHWPPEGTNPSAWPFDHLVRVHDQDHKEGDNFQYHAHPGES